MITVRGLDPAVHARLRERAARHGRSMEAEVRALLGDAVARDDEPMDVVSVFRRHFADAPVELELPKRTERPRQIDVAP